MNAQAHRAQKARLTKRPEADEKSPTELKLSNEVVKNSLFVSKFSETFHGKTDELSPYLPSESQTPLNPQGARTIESVQEVSSPTKIQPEAARTQRSSFEKERKTVTLMGSATQGAQTQNLQPQNVQINIRADNKFAPNLGEIILKESEIQNRNKSQDSTERNVHLKNVETTD